MKKQLFVIASIAAISTTAYAGQQATFGGLDADTDGYISQQEATGNEALTSQWGTLDANEDNQLDQSEFSAFEIKPTEEMKTPKAPEIME